MHKKKKRRGSIQKVVDVAAAAMSDVTKMVGSLAGITTEKAQQKEEVAAETKAFFVTLLERFDTTDEKLREDATALARKEEQELKGIEYVCTPHTWSTDCFCEN